MGNQQGREAVVDERLRSVVSSVLRIPADSVKFSLKPEDVPTWDSLGHLNLIVALEEELGVTFEIEEIRATYAGLEKLREVVLAKLSGWRV